MIRPQPKLVLIAWFVQKKLVMPMPACFCTAQIFRSCCWDLSSQSPCISDYCIFEAFEHQEVESEGGCVAWRLDADGHDVFYSCDVSCPNKCFNMINILPKSFPGSKKILEQTSSCLLPCTWSWCRLPKWCCGVCCLPPFLLWEQASERTFVGHTG